MPPFQKTKSLASTSKGYGGGMAGRGLIYLSTYKRCGCGAPLLIYPDLFFIYPSPSLSRVLAVKFPENLRFNLFCSGEATFREHFLTHL